jgi:hypothetical protein
MMLPPEVRRTAQTGSSIDDGAGDSTDDLFTDESDDAHGMHASVEDADDDQP